MSLDSGLLYQRIMHVPGLTGTWRQRADQYMRALTGRAYDGSLQTGLYLLDQIKNRNFPQAPAPAPAQPAPAPAQPAPASAGATAGQSAAKDVPTKKFEEVLRWGDYFPEELARSSAAQRSARYFMPQVTEGRENLESGYASRGLTRSSMRGRDIMKFYNDMAGREEKMRDEVYGGSELQAREDYGQQRQLYNEDPRSYSPTKIDPVKYEYDYPVEAPQRYGQAYRQWLRSAYNI